MSIFGLYPKLLKHSAVGILFQSYEAYWYFWWAGTGLTGFWLPDPSSLLWNIVSANSISEPWYSPVEPYLPCVPLTLMLELQRPEESTGSLGTGCELACGFGELNIGPLEKQRAFLSDGSSLQTLVLSFWLTYAQSWASKSKPWRGNFLSRSSLVYFALFSVL